jgi:ATP phosphoribosyltransferase
MLRIAIQKSGRLFDESIKLLKSCDLSISSGKDGNTLRVVVGNFPAEILFVRDDDIPGYVQDGIADMGIVGENVLAEQGRTLRIAEKLGFSRCRLSLAVPKGSSYQNVRDLSGLRIATTYPTILQRFLNEQGVKADIHTVSGSVELAPSIGVAEAICDLVGTGSTLVQNGLREIDVVMKSQALCIVSPTVSVENEQLVEKLLLRMRAVLRAQEYRYVLLNAPNDKLPEIIALIPGLRSPTVIPLADDGWSSVHAALRVDEFWERIEALRAVGAEGILVTSVEKMM